MPQHLANPDKIYEDGGKYLFVYRLDTKYEARVVFRENGNRPLQLVTYSKVIVGEVIRGVLKYVRK